ncbi:CHASE2 domain-containing protein [Paraburkholderia solisilvae]|uniref:histidine kinase n=1 Tax=Paraburkholderia solisilvae TaxID=624376 RepID=A0A6J5DKY2_9BURK|nr:CHASE2 domain-containing protein [Paraburkholderia solisilvae]CAB3753536.1 Adaptive-response sensory-kinase SasA [Paraburkholderia solisilvae]
MSLSIRALVRRPAGNRFLAEWLAVGCVGMMIVMSAALLHTTSSIDRLIYDSLLNLRDLPVAPQIAVIEIDDASIAELGRWPWPRSLHAQLLDQLARAHAAAVAYDVLFTEQTQDDAQLARAMSATPTYLPILLSRTGDADERTALLPVEPLAASAAGLGHINLEVDGDGIVRSVALFEADVQRRWPELVVPLYRAMHGRSQQHAARGIPDPMYAPNNDDHDGSTGENDVEQRFLIPFSQNSEAYAKYSFASVLAGRIPQSLLRDRIVLVGATASGVFDRFATPVSGKLGPMPGAYIHANVLDALLNGRAIMPVSAGATLAFALGFLALLLAGLLVLSPRPALLLAAGLCACAGLLSAVSLYAARLWVAPMPAVAGMSAVYALWNWRRLEMTLAYLHGELQRLSLEPDLLPGARGMPAEFGGDALARHMTLMAQATQRVRDMRQFIWDCLDSVPEPIWVSDAQGIVLIANRSAAAYCAHRGQLKAQGRALRDVLGDLVFVRVTRSGETADDTSLRARWPAVLDVRSSPENETHLLEQGIEVRGAKDGDYLLRYAKCFNVGGALTGWIAGLVDVTDLRTAERQQEDALRVLSHDMRSPQASILALVQMERSRLQLPRLQQMFERIERYARRTLTLADNFVQLARAESRVCELLPVSFAELVMAASDEILPQAFARHIRLRTILDDDDGGEGHWISAERSMLLRALVNILNNAVKYSPPHTEIVCSLARESGGRVRCAVRDQGYGIPIEKQAMLFERFQRFHELQLPETEGTGLGMAFVKTVITRHNGYVTVVSAPGQGTTVTVSLPALDSHRNAKPDPSGQRE